jgi:hypothetical protein
VHQMHKGTGLTGSPAAPCHIFSRKLTGDNHERRCELTYKERPDRFTGARHRAAAWQCQQCFSIAMALGTLADCATMEPT